MRVHLNPLIPPKSLFTLLHYRKSTREAVFLVRGEEVACPILKGDPEDYLALLGISGRFSPRGDLQRAILQ